MSLNLATDANFELILASASPRRSELLGKLGISFSIKPADIVEVSGEGEEPENLVKRLAEEKAAKIAVSHPQAFVLAADTIVVLESPERKVLGKPCDEQDAFRMLKNLQGREHSVYTGFSLMRKTPRYSITKIVESKVLIKRLEDEEIHFYVRTKEPADKAGAYAAQGIGSIFIERINGSYTNVVGLPMAEVSEELKKAGLWKAEFLINR